MSLLKDFKEFIELLNSNDVAYVIVGGYALAYHGHPRYTGDIDFFVNCSDENAKKLDKVIHEFGFAETGLTKNDFTEKNQVIQYLFLFVFHLFVAHLVFQNYIICIEDKGNVRLESLEEQQFCCGFN